MKTNEKSKIYIKGLSNVWAYKSDTENNFIVITSVALSQADIFNR